MLFGNQNTFGFEVQPLAPTWERRFPPESSGWAALALWVAGRNLCRHVWPGSDRLEEAVAIPLAPLCDWLLRSWDALAFEERAPLFPSGTGPFESLHEWGERAPPASVPEDLWVDSRESWWSRHFLLAGADGAFLPNVALVRNDGELTVAWKAARFAGKPAPQFLAEPGKDIVAWDDFEGAALDLVRYVRKWLRAEGPADVYDWVAGELAIGGSILDRVALYTGRTRESLAKLASAREEGEILAALDLERSENDPAASPVTQILRDLPQDITPGISRLLFDLAKRTAGVDGRALNEMRATALDAAREAASPEEAGQAAATVVRAGLSKPDAPVDVELLCGSLGVNIEGSEEEGKGGRMLVAGREEGTAHAVILRTPRTEKRWGRRFEASRALGHLLLDPWRGGTIGAASAPFAQATRRRRSGAFAAELLLPAPALERASGGALDGAAEPEAFERLLVKFGVGAQTAAHQLWNRRWLSSTDVRDELIARFAGF